MIIKGIQKTSMVDYPGLLCATLFTPGCNLRCPFCHNASLVLPDNTGENTGIDEDELLYFLQQRRGKLDAVCISGGEPLLQSGILPFLQKIKTLGYKIKLDTNGFFPLPLSFLLASGALDYVAMDIKNGPSDYARTAGLQTLDLAPVRASIELLKNADIPYEFRTTVSKTFHTEKSLKEAGEMIKGAKRWYLQAFKDSGHLLGKGITAYTKQELENFCSALGEYAETVELRGV